ncbi:iron-utilization periplasmic protein hFbpA [Xenorhabdus mauleonii]|uniref:Thiamine-binding periplasmic protein n=1 Tax=Xenorhabdus mauleonii TaxID=351675 RepID=A0A1I3RHV5_9GAMM|nr:iron-utilization periplasmic protein hFbpA [Xenorhabdus mauleonii]SFJ45432.1 thiamine transport system substrate-binding protein [Xenorhabdus mauleonii]
MFKKLFFRFIAISTLSISASVFAQEPQAKPTLTVYTYDSFASEWGPGPAIKKAFEAECHCELKLVALEDGVSLLNRLRMEGKKTPADIILGLDNNLLQAAQQTGLFTPSQVDTSKLKLPIAWKNTTFIPYDYGYFAFIYNKNTLPHPPKSMDELINSHQNLKVIYQDPRTSTPGLGLLLWMQKLYGEKVSNEWQKVAKKTLTVSKGWSEAYGLFLKGEGDMVLSYTTSPGYHIMSEKKDNYAAAIFKEGHYLQIEVAAQLASSKQPELAQKFMEFMISPAFQQVIPTTQWMYPVIDIPLPEVFKQLPVPEKSLLFNADEVAKNRTKWIRTWQSSVSR